MPDDDTGEGRNQVVGIPWLQHSPGDPVHGRVGGDGDRLLQRVGGPRQEGGPVHGDDVEGDDDEDDVGEVAWQ